MKVYIVLLHDVEAEWPHCEIGGVFVYKQDAKEYLEKRGYLNDRSSWNWYYPTDEDYAEAHIEEHVLYGD